MLSAAYAHRPEDPRTNLLLARALRKTDRSRAIANLDEHRVQPRVPRHSASFSLTELTHLTLAAARNGLEKKSFSSIELTEAYLGGHGGSPIAAEAHA